jgi:hypothetical protein
MKALAEKLKETFGKKGSPVAAPLDHPNFWMYQ